VSAGFELLRFEAVPVSDTVALLALDGRFDGPAPTRCRLLIERGGRGVEVPATTSDDGTPWSATFAIAIADLADDGTDFSLVAGRGTLFALPAPEHACGPSGEERYVQLARQANDLRRRLGTATALTSEHARAREAAEAERDVLREAQHDFERRAEDAERTAAAARDQRDAAHAAAEEARAELAQARETLRETEGRLVATERDRASLRARAHASERSCAELRERLAAAEARAQDAEARVVAAEDETRTARRDLHDTRARLESMLREQRRDPSAERRGHEVSDGDGEGAASAHAEETAVLETAQIATDDAPPVGDDDTDERPAAPTRQTRVVRIVDDPLADTGATDEVLEPAAVGARFIEPAERRGAALTPARILVGAALLLLALALVVIFLGVV
jgi:hypothetical protein